MGFLGAELSYLMLADRTDKTGTISTTIKGESYAQLLFNGSFDWNETVTGLLSLGLAMHPEHDSGVTNVKVRDYTETIASLGVRATF
ncbi:MAG: hypothetical protein EOP04_10175 [Proteobacteria bacterium]|nr:MAG: hypothetical protein EOP04_10175 [Pseudomonadota bacterium]